jgi:HEAT repeat protein
MANLLIILLVGLTQLLAAASNPLRTGPDIDDGTFLFSYPARPGVEGNDQCVRFKFGGRGDSATYFRGHHMHDEEYGPGDISTLCRVRRGQVVGLDFAVLRDPDDRPRADLDLGSISSSQAATFFLELAAGDDADVAEEAIMGAALTRDSFVIEPFLRLIRDDDCVAEAREQALFWLGVLAGEKAVEPIRGLIADEDEELELRRHAVFALSQLKEDVAFPLMMDLARNHPNAAIRQSAVIWIAEFDRPEVVNLLEEILVEH